MAVVIAINRMLDYPAYGIRRGAARCTSKLRKFGHCRRMRSLGEILEYSVKRISSKLWSIVISLDDCRFVASN